MERGGWMEALPLNRAAERLSMEAPKVDQLVVVMSQFNLIGHGLITADYKMALRHGRRVVDVIERYPNLEAPHRSFGVNFIAYKFLAEALMNHRLWAEAIDSFDRAILVRASDNTGITPSLAYIGKSHCLWRLGRVDEAWNLLESYVKSRDSYPRPEEPFK
jgi:tetratricopeptide (TPR) repeat protein